VIFWIVGGCRRHWRMAVSAAAADLFELFGAAGWMLACDTIKVARQCGAIGGAGRSRLSANLVCAAADAHGRWAALRERRRYFAAMCRNGSRLRERCSLSAAAWTGCKSCSRPPGKGAGRYVGGLGQDLQTLAHLASKSMAGRLKQNRRVVCLPHQRGWQLGAGAMLSRRGCGTCGCQGHRPKRLFSKCRKPCGDSTYRLLSRDDDVLRQQHWHIYP